ncbi:MAG TPA: hypothetical protein VFE62_04080 [Gemmataceae bacterium]|nr:hypothetical protein [Gemmataceae bacterium]
MDRWIIQSAGSVGQSYSLDQLQTMVSGGLLKPTELIVKEGESEPVPVGTVLESVYGNDPIVPQDTASIATPRRSMVRWLVLGVAILLAGGGAAAIFYATREADPTADMPDWFDPAYRVQKKRGIIFPSQSGDKARYDGRVAGPPGKYDDEWLDKNFTHYIGTENAYYWSSPGLAYTSAGGKLMAGIKAVAGPKIGGLVLICVITEDGRPENMFVEQARLHKRSKGPPKIDK